MQDEKRPMHNLQSLPPMSMFVRGLVRGCRCSGEGLHHHRADDFPTYTSMPIVEIALSVGFGTQAHLTTVFKRFAGCTPRSMARNQPGADRSSTAKKRTIRGDY